MSISHFYKDFQGLSLSRCLEELSLRKCPWFAKRLSGNDTGITESHQSGIYLPMRVAQSLFPCLYENPKERNPDLRIKVYFPSEDLSIDDVRVVYYNNKITDAKSRNEVRMTRWQGKDSPVQRAENTGSIFLFACLPSPEEKDTYEAIAWVAQHLKEEEVLEEWLGSELEPQQVLFYPHNAQDNSLSDIIALLPPSWAESFPSSRLIAELAIGHIKYSGANASRILLQRRQVEFNIFKHLEQMYTLPLIEQGFKSVDDFIKLAHSVANRRKCRTGASLEYHLEVIFREENLQFETQVITENRKKPDFLFPSQRAYLDDCYPESKLMMLAAKTCCKDRWRQVVTEANRISPKHLFTLQEGISSHQLREMIDHKVQLVIPSVNLKKFPESDRPSILSLEQFMSYVRHTQLS